jgi:hypothetical protein
MYHASRSTIILHGSITQQTALNNNFINLTNKPRGTLTPRRHGSQTAVIPYVLWPQQPH